MDKIRKTSTPLEIKKHVGAIHVKGELTLTQRKIANILLFHAYPTLLTQEKHRINIGDLAEVIGFASNNDAVLKDALKAMTKISVEWNVLDPKGRKVWGAAPFLAGAEIENGVCEYAYSPFLREKLFQPEVFARINLAIQKQFSSSYGLALYENAVRFREIGTTGMKSLEDWRGLFGVAEHQYPEFKNLKRRVIDVAITEVNGKSDIFVEVQYEHRGKKIVGMRFDIAENPKLVMNLQANSAQLENPLYLRLLEFGITSFQALDLMERFDEKRILGNLEYVHREVETGRIKNVAAFTLSAIEMNYTKKEAAIQKQISADQKKQAAKIAAQNQILHKAIEQVKEQERQLHESEEERYESAYQMLMPLEKGMIDQRVQEVFRIRYGKVLAEKYDLLVNEGVSLPEMPISIRSFALILRNELMEKEFGIHIEESNESEGV
jgi:hypothetical protein